MRSSGTVHPLKPLVPRMAVIPRLSLMADAARKADALVSIGRWTVVFIPSQPVDPSACRQDSPPAGIDPDPCVAPQALDIPSHTREPCDPAGLALPVPPELPAASSDSPSHPLPALARPVPLGNPIPSREASDPGVGMRMPLAPSLEAMELGPPGSARFSALSWALLSQVFWVPLLAIDLHDRWTGRQHVLLPPGPSLSPSPVPRATALPFHAPFGALGQLVRGTSSGSGVLLSRAGSDATSLLDRPLLQSLDAPSAPSAGLRPASPGLPPALSPAGSSLLGRAFNRAQLLGGSVSLDDLHEGPMAPLALVERALQRSSNDPLAPLPPLWREPMRQALQKLPGAPLQLDTARMVVVPSRSLSQPVEVPLALQSDGSVDILEFPANAVVLAEIEAWSRQQRLPASGSLVPAVVELHPLPQVGPIAFPTADASTPTPAAGGGTASASASQPASPSPQRPSPASGATAAPVPLPLRSEAPPPAAAVSIPLPIQTEASAPVAPAAALAEPAAAPLP